MHDRGPRHKTPGVNPGQQLVLTHGHCRGPAPERLTRKGRRLAPRVLRVTTRYSRKAGIGDCLGASARRVSKRDSATARQRAALQGHRRGDEKKRDVGRRVQYSGDLWFSALTDGKTAVPLSKKRVLFPDHKASAASLAMSGNAPGKMRAPREPKPVKDPAQQAVRMAEHARKRQEYDESKAQHREAMAQRKKEQEATWRAEHAAPAAGSKR